MDALTRMMTVLGQTGLYRVTEDSFLAVELKAYAAALDYIRESLEIMRRERFVPTAQSYGLYNLESITGREMERAGVENRREMLLYRLAITPNDYTRRKVEQALTAVGIEAAVSETTQGLYINVIRLLNPDITRENIQSAAMPFLSAHLPCTFDFLPQSWAVFDEQDLSWNAHDALDRTWIKFEEYGGM